MLSRRRFAPVAALAATAMLLFAHTSRAAAADSETWRIPSNEVIQQLLTERMQHNGVGTVVGIIEPAGQRVVVYGRSGAANGRALDGDTVFQIGSLTKVFTSLLLADMVQRGDVRLDDPAQRYLPAGVTMPQKGRPITLWDLATHRSGLPSMPDNFRLDAEPNPIEAYSVSDLHAFLNRYTPVNAPGEKYEYSNLAVSVLGRLLAKQQRKSYSVLLYKRVLKPLQLHDTSITLSDLVLKRLAPGHDRYLRRTESWEMRTLQASGSLRSTANDLLKLLAAYLGYTTTPLQQAMQLQLATRYPTDPRAALAWGVQKIAVREVFSHEGGKQGYRSAVAFDTASRTGVVVLSNARTDDRPMALALHLLTGRALPLAPAAPPAKPIAPLDARMRCHYAGRYRLSAEEVLTVASKADRLLVDYRGDGQALEFLPSSAADFFYNGGNDDISFQFDRAGRITGLWLYDDGRAAAKYRVAVRE